MNLYNDNIKFIHYRRFNVFGMPKARGGMTVAYYIANDGTIMYENSKCSDKDNFSYAEGRKWAVSRLKNAFRNTSSPKNFRMQQDAFARSMGYNRVFSRKKKSLPECIPA